jgi:hypothetical protein
MWRMAKPQTFLFIFRIPPQLRAQVQFESGAWPNLKPSFSFLVSHRSYLLKCILKVVRGQTSDLPYVLKCSWKVVRSRIPNLPFHFSYHTAAACSSSV